MKFCKDCFYYRESAKGLPEYKYATCERTKTYDMVSGVATYQFCSIERESKAPNKCGLEAQYFAVPDEREWQRDEPQGVTNWDTGWNAQYERDTGVM